MGLSKAVLSTHLSRAEPHHIICLDSHAELTERRVVVGGSVRLSNARRTHLLLARVLHRADAVSGAGEAPPAPGRQPQAQRVGPGAAPGGALRVPGQQGQGVLCSAAHLQRVRPDHHPGQDHQRQPDPGHGVPLGRPPGLPQSVRRHRLPVRRRAHLQPLRDHRGALHREVQPSGDGAPGRARRAHRSGLLHPRQHVGVRAAGGGRARRGGHLAPRVRQEHAAARRPVERHRAAAPRAPRRIHQRGGARVPAQRHAPRTGREGPADEGAEGLHVHRRRLGQDRKGRGRRRERRPSQVEPADHEARGLRRQVQPVPEQAQRGAADVRHRQERAGRVLRGQRRAPHQRHVPVEPQGALRAPRHRVLRPHRVRLGGCARHLHARHALLALDHEYSPAVS